MKPNCESFDEVTVSAPPMPRHVGIIMDGNGRWAQERGRSRLIGHHMGAMAVKRTVREAARLGIEQLTLFAFSTENWRRPAAEVRFLWRLIRRFLRAECKELRDNGIRLRAVGRLDGLPEEVRSELRRTIAFTSGGGALTLCLAVNYGGRAEVVDACRQIVRRAVGGSGAKRFVRRRSHGQHQFAAIGDLLVGNPASRDGFAVERGGLDAGIFAGIIFRDDRE